MEKSERQDHEEQPLPIETPDGELHGWKLATIIACLCLSTFLLALDTTIIGVAIPKISSEFKSLEDIGWYGSGYLVTVMGCQASSATIYKYFRVKSTYLVSIAIFEVGSIICAAAPSSAVFIFGRAIAGVGAAGLFQGALCIIGLTIALQKRPFYIGIVVAVFGPAAVCGPVIGGALTDHASWRWCFWINVPLGVVAWIVLAILLKVKDDNIDRQQPLATKLKHTDYIGTVLLFGATVCLLLALQWGGQSLPWNSSQVIGLLVGFVATIFVFALFEWSQGEKAIVPLRVLKQRSVAMGTCFVFFVQMSSYTNSFYIPFYFQAVQGVSVTESGVRFLPIAITQIVAVVVSGAIVSKTGHYVPLMIFGQLVAIVGTALLSRITIDYPTVYWASCLVVMGLGLGLGMQLPFTALQVVLSEQDIAIGNAIAIFGSQLGGAIAVTAGQTIMIGTIFREVAERTDKVSPQSVVDAGASNLERIFPSNDLLLILRQVYSKGVDNTLLFSVAAAAAAVPFAIMMEWLNVKTEAKKREDMNSTGNDRDLKRGSVISTHSGELTA